MPASVIGKGRTPPAEVDRRCARFERDCRGKGVRLTAQRLAVYRVLAADPTHPTAAAVHARLRRPLPSLSLATVYRILESLEGKGLARRVSTTGGVGRYDANLGRHQHLVCRKCGRMEDWTDARFARLVPPRRAGAGFLPEDLDIRIVGTCARCRGRRGGAAGRRRRA